MQPQPEHQKDQPQLRERVNALLIAHHRHLERVRPDKKPGQNVAKHHRLLETMKYDRHHAGDDHDDRQILEKRYIRHASVLSGRNKCTSIEAAKSPPPSPPQNTLPASAITGNLAFLRRQFTKGDEPCVSL